MNKKDYASLAITAAMFLTSIYFYPQMPEKMAIHWNAQGKVDGYGSRTVGLFIIPVITTLIYGFFLVIPKIEVFKENIKAFIQYFDNIKLAFVLFMLVIYTVMILQNMGYEFNMGMPVILAVAALFYYLAHVMPKMKRNFFIGIRTPWTLANEKVWDETHKIGEKTFKLNAIVLLLALLAPQHMIAVVLISVIANVLFLFIYSYWLYQRENKNELE